MLKPKRSKLEGWIGQEVIMKSFETGTEYSGKVAKITPPIGFFECFVAGYFPKLTNKIAGVRTRYLIESKEMTAKLIWVYSADDEEIIALAHNSGLFHARINHMQEYEQQF